MKSENTIVHYFSIFSPLCDQQQQQPAQHYWTFQNNDQQDSFNTTEPCKQQGLSLPCVPALMPHRTWQTRLQNTVNNSDVVGYPKPEGKIRLI